MPPSARFAPGPRTLLALATAAATVTLPLVAQAAEPTNPAQQDTAPPAEQIHINGQDPGRTFDGVGALSASSSRLLVDYPEPERSQILDYLFKPNYGANLQTLKVEIGGDTNSTSGAEPSHMRTPTDLDCNRGFEWWLMHEAKERNPDIKLYGLVWGLPGWVDKWTQEHVDYLVEWLGCAEQQGLTIDYLGGGNESGALHHGDFFVKLDQALEAEHPDVKIVADDDHRPPNYWGIASRLTDNEAFRDAVDIVGVHTICGWRSPYRSCASSDEAKALDKPLWISEQSSQDAQSGAAPLARAMTRSYIDSRTTAMFNWSMMAGFYSTVRTAGTGLMLAQQPWSGYYELGAGMWVDAHVTQFTEPGWRYIDSASGYLDSGASYTTLRDPDSGDYTMLVETVDADGPTTLDVDVTGGLSDGDVHVWSTEVKSPDDGDWFVQQGATTPADGAYSVTLEPGRMYTLSTTTGQHKGSATPDAGRDEHMDLPHAEDFEGLGEHETAPYFADLEGAFEPADCGGDRDGTCYRQVITEHPVCWHCGSLPDMPTTVMGDPQWWGDYEITTDAMLEEPGFVELVGRSETHTRETHPGYHLRVDDAGQWRLYAEDAYGAETDLASGTTATPFGLDTWHELTLRFTDDQIVVAIDGDVLARVSDGTHTTGMVGLGVSPYQRAQFDDVEITPTEKAPRFVPHETMTASASSTHEGLFDHHFYSPDRAIDGRPETMWGSEWDPKAPLPQSITLELDRPRAIHGLTYQPRLDTYRNENWGNITGYTVSTSLDGENFTEVSSGTWPVNTATKTDTWSRPHPAKYVRLTATSGVDGIAVIGELDLAAAPLR
ncbi:F5/8 type C domain-containing protein [Haloactinopolyspora alba]|uniref:galactosylceramidase n=1 Tax=Haloactinopolyspora alba TaxID=648780 RepID=A0A2P8EG73_9ACTN|nr:discoidin domain-containing protein [Haloactinopolyspora alba]PSL08468.1 F5/8 type C domain-containing protein [Haloactinopolyspora alba]